MNKWIFRIFGLIIFIFLGLIAFVEINKEEIVARVVKEVNKSLKTPVTYREADVSLIKNFPDLSVSLLGFNISSDSISNEYPLIQLGEASIALNIVDVIRNSDHIEINTFTIKDGHIHIVNRKDGTNNYDIMMQSEESSPSEPLSLTINNYSLEKIDIIYSDLKTGDQYKIRGLNSLGKIKYNNGAINVLNNIEASLEMDMLNTPLDLAADIELDVDAAYETFTLNKGQFKFNDLPIDFNGSASMRGENYSYNFDVKSPSTEIRSLLSLLPQVYRNEYESMVSSGAFTLSGKVSGDDKGVFPLYSLQLKLDNGKMSYPDLKKAIDHISFDIEAKNTSSNTMYTQVKIQDLLAKLGSSEISGDANTKSNGQSNDIDLNLSSNLNLEDVYESFHWSDVTTLSGTVRGDIKLNTTVDNTNTINVTDEDLDIDLIVKDIVYDNNSTGKVTTQTILLKGGAQAIDYVIDDFNYPGIENAYFKGKITQPLNMLAEIPELKGDVDINIGLIDFIALTKNTDTSSVSAVYVIPTLQFTTTAIIKKINYPPYNIEGIQANGKVTDKVSTLSYTIDEINNNKFYGNGELVNVLQYGLNSDTLRGKLELRSDALALDSFISEEETKTPESTEPLIPGNLAIDIDYSVNKMTYQKLDLSKAIGDLSIAEQKVQITNSAEVFGGAITFTGIFDAIDPLRPNIDLNIDISKISFQETANQLAFFNKILPIASFFEGEYNGTLNWKSDLTADYFPDLNTLTAFGEIETKNGGIASFVPIDSILSYFGKNETVQKSRWQLDDTKKYFLVEDGRVIVKKVNMQKDDIAVSFAGSHSFSQDIDYDMVVTIPKDKIKIDKVYGLVTKTLKLSNELNNLTDEVMIDLVLKLGGKLNKPTFNLSDVRIKRGNVVQSIKESAIATATEKKEQIESTVRDTIDFVKNTVKDSIDAIKNKAEAQIDSVKTEINNQIDSSKKEVSKAATGLLDSLKAGKTDSIGAALDDVFKDQKDKISKIKDKIKINIFKKKTKE